MIAFAAQVESSTLLVLSPCPVATGRNILDQNGRSCTTPSGVTIRLTHSPPATTCSDRDRSWGRQLDRPRAFRALSLQGFLLQGFAAAQRSRKGGDDVRLDACPCPPHDPQYPRRLANFCGRARILRILLPRRCWGDRSSASKCCEAKARNTVHVILEYAVGGRPTDLPVQAWARMNFAGVPMRAAGRFGMAKKRCAGSPADRRTAPAGGRVANLGDFVSS